MTQDQKRVIFELPKELIAQIDAICKTHYISRRKWFFELAKAGIEKEKRDKIDRVVRGIN